jgi:hypothetical protein
MRYGQIVLRQIRPRFDEPFRIERDAAVEPAGVWNGSCHNEDVADVARLDVPGLVVPPANHRKKDELGDGAEWLRVSLTATISRPDEIFGTGALWPWE